MTKPKVYIDGQEGTTGLEIHGGPAADSVKQQIANIKAFVEGRAHG